MPRVICWQVDCLHNADGRCRAEEVEYDPVDGCLTSEPRVELQDSQDADDAGWGRGRVYLRGHQL